MTGFPSKKAAAQDKLESMEREALKLALEALLRSRKAVSGDYDLASCAYGSNDPDGHRYQDAKKAKETLKQAITAIKEALAQPVPVQEPVAKVCHDLEGHIGWNPKLTELPEEGTGLYTAAQPAQEPVSDTEILAWAERHDVQGTQTDLRSMFEDAASLSTPLAQPAQERNFCPRCGKRTNDIHTCTPPQEKT